MYTPKSMPHNMSKRDVLAWYERERYLLLKEMEKDYKPIYATYLSLIEDTINKVKESDAERFNVLEI